MRMALPYPTMTFLSFYAAVEKGFLAEEGVDLEILHVAGGGAAIMEMFLHGEVDFLFAHWEMVEIAMRGELEVRALCGSIADPYCFFVRPEIKSFADLKGKNVMVGPRGSGSNTEARYCLIQAGLDPEKDVNFVVGDYRQRIQALHDPNIHAMQDRTQTWYWAQKAGWRYIKSRGSDPLLGQWRSVHHLEAHRGKAGAGRESGPGCRESDRLHQGGQRRRHRPVPRRSSLT